jgi:hypothetical protein
LAKKSKSSSKSTTPAIARKKSRSRPEPASPAVDASGSEPARPAVAIGTSSFRQQYLLAFASQPEVCQYLRTQLIPDEAPRTPEILRAWADAQPRVQALIQSEAGIADTIQIEEVPAQSGSAIEAMLNSDLVRKAFQLQYGVGVVEIDKLVAAQRAVNLEYVDQLRADFKDDLSFDALAKICLSSDRKVSPIQHLELGQNVHAFSSPSSDLRFLGSFLIENLTPDLMTYAQGGGSPAAAVISLIGYGAYPINVYKVGPRVVLANGFHRVYTLRSLGVSHIPVLIQQADNWQLEFPPVVAGVQREYLILHPRPVLMKDFFEQGFTATIHVRNRLKLVTVQSNVGQHDVPS